jgi:hypothetical protein
VNRKKFLSVFLITLFIGATTIGALARTLPDQPNMTGALASLEAAKHELQVAEANKGGHREKAIELVNQAITEVNKGIAAARAHERKTLSSRDQPHMKAAWDNLVAARNYLGAATANKNGHRIKAIELVNKAIEEVRKGMAVAG